MVKQKIIRNSFCFLIFIFLLGLLGGYFLKTIVHNQSKTYKEGFLGFSSQCFKCKNKHLQRGIAGQAMPAGLIPFGY
jgi:hypothetical protein